MRSKYIMVEFLDENEREHQMPILFPQVVIHEDMWKAVARGLHGALRPLSAGFVEQRGDRLVCYGRSESLRLDSRPEADTFIGNSMDLTNSSTVSRNGSYGIRSYDR